MTNEMIPISEIDKLITGLENKLYEWRNFQVVELLKKIKQKAIPAIPISKIDAKIKELRETPDQFGSSIYYYHSEVIKRVYEELEDLKK